MLMQAFEDEHAEKERKKTEREGAAVLIAISSYS